MNEAELRTLIAASETLSVEFKSDRGPLADADLLETVVCLANAQGGALRVGVEDDGTIRIYAPTGTQVEEAVARIESMTKEAIKKVPRYLKSYARDPKNDLIFDGETTFAHCEGDLPVPTFDALETSARTGRTIRARGKVAEHRATLRLVRLAERAARTKPAEAGLVVERSMLMSPPTTQCS